MKKVPKRLIFSREFGEKKECYFSNSSVKNKQATTRRKTSWSTGKNGIHSWPTKHKLFVNIVLFHQCFQDSRPATFSTITSSLQRSFSTIGGRREQKINLKLRIERTIVKFYICYVLYYAHKMFIILLLLANILMFSLDIGSDILQTIYLFIFIYIICSPPLHDIFSHIIWLYCYSHRIILFYCLLILALSYPWADKLKISA